MFLSPIVIAMNVALQSYYIALYFLILLIANVYVKTCVGFECNLRFQGCDIPPDLWCDSYDAAQRCGVLHQCEQFGRSRKPLKLTLIYEALCPYCQRFITNHLGNLYGKFRNSIELELVPWGNSRLLRDGTISCNHGVVECEANRLHGCVLHHTKMKHALPFIICFERSLGSNVETALQYCSGFIRHHYRNIRHCFESEEGKQLQRTAAFRTMSVRPNPIVEVPYLLINDYSPHSDTNDLNMFALQHLLRKWIRFQGKRRYSH